MSRPHSHEHPDKSKLISSSGQKLLIFSIATIKMHIAWIASKTKHVFPTIKQTIKGKESSGEKHVLLANQVFCILMVTILNIRSSCPEDEINLLLSGCSCECGLDTA